ncbi:MAG: chromosome segregation protein SMC, partial [Planctomycetaceae bacterium]
ESRTAAATAQLDCERTTRQLADVDLELARLTGELASLEPDLQVARAESGAMSDHQARLTQSVATLDAEVLDAEETLHAARSHQAAARAELARFENQLQTLRQSQSRLDQERFQRDLQHEEADRRFQLLAERRIQVEAEVRKTEELLQGLQAEQAELEAAVMAARQEREAARQRRGELAQRDLELRHQLRHAEEQRHASQMRATELKHALSSIADRLRDEFQLEIDEVLAGGYSARAQLRAQRATEGGVTANRDPDGQHPDSQDASGQDPASQVPGADTTEQHWHAGDSPGHDAQYGQPAAETEEQAEADRQLIEEQINRLRRKLKNLGQVNAESLRELDELEARYARLAGQLQDLQEAKASLEEIIRKINVESRRIFLECFEEIRRNFRDLFRKQFGGGEGDVVLENPDDVLECGIDVVARPPGKDLRSLSLLSGGEKTMAAVAMLLAIFKSKPSPFCILDEVDAALDEGNVNRYLNVLREFQEWTQFIVVTHNKRTMSGAEVLYGVTMEEAGVSKRMSVRFEDIGEDGHFRAAA